MKLISEASDSDEPSIELYLWGAYLLFIPSLDGPTVHLAGYNPQTMRSRVSSPVKLVHVAQRRVITESGRVYHLVGKPGRKAFCMSALRNWAPALDSVCVSDVTRTLLSGAHFMADEVATIPSVLH